MLTRVSTVTEFGHLIGCLLSQLLFVAEVNTPFASYWLIVDSYMFTGAPACNHKIVKTVLFLRCIRTSAMQWLTALESMAFLTVSARAAILDTPPSMKLSNGHSILPRYHAIWSLLVSTDLMVSSALMAWPSPHGAEGKFWCGTPLVLTLWLPYTLPLPPGRPERCIHYKNSKVV